MRTRGVALVCVALSSGVIACGGPRFTGEGGQGGAGTSGAGAGAGKGGASGAGGVAGAGGMAPGGAGGSAGSGGGLSGSSGSGNAGRAGAAGCDCAAGQYCRSGTCRDCSDLSSVQIGTPEEVLDHPSSGLRFPRVGSSPASLFFTLVGPSRSELWYVENPSASASFTLGDAQTPARSGLFFVAGDELAFNVLFDQLENGQRAIHSAAWDGSALSSVRPGGAPFGAGEDEHAVAFAGRTRRAYFMSTKDGAPALHTGVLGDGSTDVILLDVPAQGGDGTCPRSGEDATPWVTEDGSLLVFRSLPVDASCEPVDGAATDLYVAALEPSTGLPLTRAVPLTGVNVTGGQSTETDASFSPDLCVLYFASDGGSAGGFDFRLFRASRR